MVCNKSATRHEYELRDQEGHVIKVKTCGLIINPKFPYLAASPDGIVDLDVIESGLFECKNILKDKPITFFKVAESVKGFCLTKLNSQLKLKRTHQYYFQCQGQLNIANMPWVDFVVRSQNPNQFFVERIFRDSDFWDKTMLPKHRFFYFNVLLPELAVPRNGMNPGIREPGSTWV